MQAHAYAAADPSGEGEAGQGPPAFLRHLQRKVWHVPLQPKTHSLATNYKVNAQQICLI